jgi:arylsulfatase A-like enzyme
MLAVLVLLGCSGDRQPEPAVQRLVERPPGSDLDLARLYDRVAVAPWLADDAEQWKVLEGSISSAPDGLLLSAESNRHASIWRQVAVDAARVDVVVVRTTARPIGAMQLYWAAPGERFAADVRSDPDGVRELPSGEFEIEFVVRDAPDWRGRIDRIRFTAVLRFRESPLVVTAVEGARQTVDTQALEAASGTPWVVELDHERRYGFVAAPGQHISWRPESRRGDRLTLGFGAKTTGAARALFRVATSNSRQPLFEATVGRGHLSADRWHDAAVDVSDAAGSELRFEHEVIADPGDGEGGAVAFWAGPELASPRASDRPNLLLVSLDTVRPDHLSLYGYGRPTTPRLDRWAENAAVFEQAVTTAPWTLPAHLSMLTGLDAFEHGVNHRSRVPGELELLAETLREAGYRTAAVTGGGFLEPEYGLHQGFDSYRYYPHHTDEGELAHGLQAALDWLSDGPRQPWFVFFHTYEPHYPYHARRPYLERLNGGAPVPDPRDLAYVTTGLDMEHAFELTKRWRFRRRGEPRRELTAAELAGLIDLYDSGIAYSDDMLRRLLEAVEDAGEAVVAITSDHGEALGEHGLAGHAYLEDFNALIPLALKRPGRREGRRIGTQVRITDLAPTFLELAGLEPTTTGSGRSLVPLLDGVRERDREAAIYASFANRGLALRLGRRAKYLFNNSAWESLWGRQALYDLTADPDEWRDLAAVGADVEPLARRARALADGVQGVLRIAFANHSSRDLRGTLGGSVLQAARLRSPRLPAGAVTWESTRTVALLLPAGKSFDLLLENPPGSRLRLALEPDLRLDLDLEEAGRGEWRLLDGGWSAQRGDASEPAARVAVTWPRHAVAAGDPGEADAELRVRLRALGYVE